MVRKIIILLLVALVVIQFFHPTKNISLSEQPNAIGKKYPIPADVDTILHNACYDCHSNNSNYPWYFKVQPIAWLLAKHIEDGKRELNFDEFLTYPENRQDHKLKEFIDEVDQDEMPLSSYTLMHSEARIDKQQKEAIVNWAKGIRAKLKK